MFERHLANTLELVCDLAPERTALIHGDLRRSRGELDERASRLGAALMARGIGCGDTLAIAMFNSPEWIETYYATIKIRAVPTNVNYRYQGDELLHVLKDCGARALVFHASLADNFRLIRGELPGIGLWIMVDDTGGMSEFDGAEKFESLIAGHAPAARIARPASDNFLSYTGGTTGLPRGVLYDLGRTAGIASRYFNAIYDTSFTTEDDPLSMATWLLERELDFTVLVAPPLMHSTGLAMTAIPTLAVGGAVVTLARSSLDAHHVLEEIERNGVGRLSIVGDAFARPLLHALGEGRPDGTPYRCGSLKLISSSGAAWTESAKAGFFDYLPGVALMESCGATEGVSYGIKVSRLGQDVKTGSFLPLPGLVLVDEDLEPLPRQTGEKGLLASPTLAAGYLNDPRKTAAHYRLIGGIPYAIPGDYGRLEADGTLTLLGRGSSVINTGGEKVHPEEVEDVVKQLAGIDDCLVLGLTHTRFGQQVAALVQLAAGVDKDPGEIIAHVKQRLASYKAPREVIFVSKVPRGPNGKADFKRAARLAEVALDNPGH